MIHTHGEDIQYHFTVIRDYLKTFIPKVYPSNIDMVACRATDKRCIDDRSKFTYSISISQISYEDATTIYGPINTIPMLDYTPTYHKLILVMMRIDNNVYTKWFMYPVHELFQERKTEPEFELKRRKPITSSL